MFKVMYFSKAWNRNDWREVVPQRFESADKAQAYIDHILIGKQQWRNDQFKVEQEQ
mgnify:CR=1 FL=1